MRSLRYIFLTEWQPCAKRVDPRVLRRAQGGIKPTAHSTHGPPCSKDGGTVVAPARSFDSPIGPWSKKSVTFHDTSEIAMLRSVPAFMIHGQILADASQLQRPWFLESVCQRQHWWLEETELMLTEVQVRAGHGDNVQRWNPSGSRLQNRGAIFEATREASKFDKNAKLGQGFGSASQEHTLLSRGVCF